MKKIVFGLLPISVFNLDINSSATKPVKRILSPKKRMVSPQHLTVAAIPENQTIAAVLDITIDGKSYEPETPKALAAFEARFRVEASKIYKKRHNVRQQYVQKTAQENADLFSTNDSEAYKIGLIIDTIPTMFINKYVDLYKKLYKHTFNQDPKDSQALIAATKQYKLHQADDCCAIL